MTKNNFSERGHRNPSVNSQGEELNIYKNEKLLCKAQVADSFLEKIKGAMFEEIAENKGLLIKFRNEGKYGIWMLFVPHDLALFFLNRKGEVVDRKLAKKFTLNPKSWKIYKPRQPCKYVLECNHKKMNEVKVGDKLEWQDG